MANAVFTTKVNPEYDDVPELRYHFPQTYLRVAQSTVGDWIVYYEPRREGAADSGRSGRMAYFAIARIDRIERDPARADHHYAYVTDYLEFLQPVPFRSGDQYFESALRKPDGSTNRGAFGRAVRHIPAVELAAIAAVGFAEERIPLVGEPIAEPESVARERVARLVTRPERDRLFTEQIRKAYDATCAMTGLRLEDGRRYEFEAAHIRPVGDGHDGPDSPRNGLALSRTFHWMFDRGLVSLTNDYRVLMANGRVPAQLQQMLHAERRLVVVPREPSLRPHRQFLAYHRDRIFRG